MSHHPLPDSLKVFLSVMSVLLPLVLILIFPQIESFVNCKEYSSILMIFSFIFIFPFLFIALLSRGIHILRTKTISLPLFTGKTIKLDGFKAQVFSVLLLLFNFTLIPFLYIKMIPYMAVKSCPPVDFLRDIWYFFMPF